MHLLGAVLVNFGEICICTSISKSFLELVKVLSSEELELVMFEFETITRFLGRSQMWLLGVVEDEESNLTMDPFL